MGCCGSTDKEILVASANVNANTSDTTVRVRVVNESHCVTDAQVQQMIAACNVLLPIMCAAWDVEHPLVIFATAPLAKQDWIFHVVDRNADDASDPGEPPALAYHSEDDDIIDGYIAAKTVLDNGGVPLYQDRNTPTVAAALFHEIAESWMDRYCNSWWQYDKDNRLYASEVCDPVQSGVVVISIEGNVRVGLSDFIYPRWCDSQSKTGPFNYLNTLTAPFSVDRDGYVILLDGASGETQELYGPHTASWIRQWKGNSHRVRQRRTRSALARAKIAPRLL